MPVSHAASPWTISTNRDAQRCELIVAPTETTILSQLRQQFEVVEEGEVAATVATFERLLGEAVEQPRREHPSHPPRLRLE